MKWFALMALVLALIATVSCSDEPACAAQEFSDAEIAEMFLCLANGTDFNGKKTCQVGCRVACQQPGCGGFHSCTQIPNPGEASTYLHKYKCRCNSS